MDNEENNTVDTELEEETIIENSNPVEENTIENVQNEEQTQESRKEENKTKKKNKSKLVIPIIITLIIIMAGVRLSLQVIAKGRQ